MRFLFRLFVLIIFSTSSAWSQEELSKKPYIIFLYGAKGSGSGVMAVRLKKNFLFPDISLASLISNHILEETPLGEQAKQYLVNGKELPTELSLSILCERLQQKDCTRGSIFEDFPLIVDYFQLMNECISSYFRFLVIYINASDDWLAERSEHRFVCRICGKVYDEATSSLKNKGFCDICLEPLHRRQEDSPEVVKIRVQNYRTQLAPLLNIYQREKILVEINGERPFDTVYKDVINTIEAHTGLQKSDLPATSSQK
jgi:adenylate kinase